MWVGAVGPAHLCRRLRLCAAPLLEPDWWRVAVRARLPPATTEGHSLEWQAVLCRAALRFSRLHGQSASLP